MQMQTDNYRYGLGLLIGLLTVLHGVLNFPFLGNTIGGIILLQPIQDGQAPWIAGGDQGPLFGAAAQVLIMILCIRMLAESGKILFDRKT